MDYKELQKIYSKKSVNKLVKEVQKHNLEAISNGKEVMYRLWYLEKSRRYQEYDGYKKIPFKTFVYEICHIPYNRYKGLLLAYNWFPKESEKFGPHVVQTVKSKVGMQKLPKVLKEITKEVGSLTDPGKQREKIYQVIDRHTPIKKENIGNDTKVYWRNKALDVEKRYKELEAENKELIATIKELQEQIERQKPFVEAAISAQSSMKDLPRLSA